jgi:hypothetical protein
MTVGKCADILTVAKSFLKLALEVFQPPLFTTGLAVTMERIKTLVDSLRVGLSFHHYKSIKRLYLPITLLE